MYTVSLRRLRIVGGGNEIRSRWLTRKRKQAVERAAPQFDETNLTLKMLASIPSGVNKPISRESKYKPQPFSGNPKKRAARRALSVG